MKDLAARLANRIQLTTDGHRVYVDAVEAAFGSDIDYSMLIKLYGELEGKDADRTNARYSAPEFSGIRIVAVSGSPDLNHVSTSYVERQNLTMRMHMRRFTRLTNGFSKKVENHAAAIALHFMYYYNFVKTHQSLRMTPAMAAGVVSSPMSVEDLVKLVEERERGERAKKSERYGAVEGAGKRMRKR
jgi:hypothetical protein